MLLRKQSIGLREQNKTNLINYKKFARSITQSMDGTLATNRCNHHVHQTE